MNPTTPVLALLMLGVSGVYGQTEAPPDSTFLGGSTVRFDRHSLSLFPSRDLSSILINAPGIWNVNGDIHIRGSRTRRTGYALNGFSVLDRFTNTLAFPFIPEAIEQLDISTGTTSPVDAMNGGGSISMRLKQGGERFAMSARLLTDGLASPGAPTLNTYSYGWQTAVVTAEGSLPFSSTFFIASEFHRANNRRPTYLEPTHLTLVADPYGSGFSPPPLPLTIDRNTLPKHSLDRRAVQWNITSSALGVRLSFIGSSGLEEKTAYEWPDIIRNYYRLSRTPSLVNTHNFLGLNVTMQPLEPVSVSASIGWFGAKMYTDDPDFGRDWLLYSDSAANAARGYTGFQTHYSNNEIYSAVYSFQFLGPNRPNNSYAENDRSVMFAKLDAEWTVHPSLSVSASSEAEWWHLRAFSVSALNSYLSIRRAQYYSSERSRIADLGVYTENIGYDVFGRQTDDGLHRARAPFFGALSLSGRYRDGPLTLKLGLRNQYIGQDLLRLKGATPDALPYDYPAYDWSVWPPSIDENQLEFSPVIGYLLPRMSATYDAGSYAFAFGGGAYIDAPAFDGLHQDFDWMERRLNPSYRSGYNLSKTPNLTMLARPERTSHVEASGSWRPDSSVTLGLTVYRKRLYDQLEQAKFIDVPGNVWLTGLVNAGESSITGIETTIRWRFSASASAQLVYAYADAIGNVRDPSDWAEVGYDQPFPSPDLMLPLPYAQEHRLILSVDVAASERSDLSGLRARFLGRFISGHPYTLHRQYPYLGSQNIFLAGVRPLADPTFSLPAEPYFNSRIPSTISCDLHAEYALDIDPLRLLISIDVLNVFDTKRVLEHYPTTGSSTSDGWLGSTQASAFVEFEQFEEFYTALNLKNRWAFMSATGKDMYDSPRQLFLGLGIVL